MKNSTRSVFKGMLTMCAFGIMQFASAAVPDGLNYQAYLSNADGSVFDGSISITFAAYNVDIGGVPLWSQTEGAVAVEQGLFSVTLGNPVNPFPPGLFDGPVYIGLFVAGEEMLPRRMLTTSAYAFKASDADTLTGATATDLDQTAEVAALEGDVLALGSDITSLGGDIAANETRITDLETTGADITAVSAGPGLAGGGTSGDVSVGVAPGGINASMMGANSVNSSAIVDNSITAADIASNAVGAAEIQPGAVGASEIAPGAVGASQIAPSSVFGSAIVDNTITALDIASNAVGESEIAPNAVGASEIATGAVGTTELNAAAAFTMAGLTVNGTAEMNGATDLYGALTILSGADIAIQDNFNALRWYSSDGLTEFGAILARSTEFSFYDTNNSRYAIHSDVNGVGIGTLLNDTGYAVSVPSLSVAGATNVGLQRVSANYVMSSPSSSCHSHGNLACYFGSGTVSCPVGTRVVGGGASGTTGALFGSIGRNYPDSDTSWACSSSYDLPDITRSCFALCARLE